MIDAHAEIHVEVACSVIPPGVTPLLGMAQPVRVNESATAKAGERLPLALGDVGSTMTGSGVPRINVFGNHIEVNAHRQLCGAVDGLVQPSGEPIEPCQLGLVKRPPDDPAAG